jgi:type II secretory pathway pseudopilin PulG
LRSSEVAHVNKFLESFEFAIIAILAALLLPALSKAKARAQRIRCLSNMKQLGLGIAMLTTDRQEMYPPAVYSSGDVTYQLT